MDPLLDCATGRSRVRSGVELESWALRQRAMRGTTGPTVATGGHPWPPTHYRCH